MEVNPASGAHLGIGDTGALGVRGRSSTRARDVAESTSSETLKRLSGKLDATSEVRDDLVEQVRKRLEAGALDTLEAAEGAARRLLEEGI